MSAGVSWKSPTIAPVASVTTAVTNCVVSVHPGVAQPIVKAGGVTQGAVRAVERGKRAERERRAGGCSAGAEAASVGGVRTSVFIRCLE